MTTRAAKLFNVLKSAAIAAVLLCAGCKKEQAKNSVREEKNRAFIAEKRSFDVTYQNTGRLDVARRHEIRCPTGPIQFQVSELLKDRTEVKKGDVIAKLATDKLQAELTRVIESQSDEEKELEIEKKEKELLMDLLAQEIKDTCTDYYLAHLDHRLYIEKESVAKAEELQDAMRKAAFAAQTAEEGLEKLQRQLLATAAQESNKRNQLSAQVAAAKNKAIDAQFRKKEAARTLTKFKHQEYRDEVAKNQKKMYEALNKWQKAVLNAKTRLRQQNLKIFGIESKLKHIASERKVLEDLKTKMVIKAPVAGIITLRCKHPDDVNEKGETEPVLLSSNSIIAEIPDCSKFIIKAQIPEGHRPRIANNMKAVITAKALPGWKTEARITKIAPTARSRNRWDQSNKSYPIELTLANVKDERLMPGITLDIELISQSITNVIALPIECVELKKGVPYCSIETATGISERKVEIGKSSDHYVEVKNGIKVGERVLFISDGSDG